MDDRNGKGGIWPTERNQVVMFICVSGPWTVAFAFFSLPPHPTPILVMLMCIERNDMH